MFTRLLVAATLAVLSAFPATAREFDAEADIGLVADNPAVEVAAKNTARLNAALDAQWSGGKFSFVGGHVGPLLHPIRCAAKQFFFVGTIKTSRRAGGSLYGASSRAFITTDAEFAPHGQFGGAVTRFTRIDGQKGGPILRLRGSGFVLDGICMLGRRWPGVKDLQWVGVRTESCIEVEGWSALATGVHTIRNCLLGEATYGIRTIPGFYTDAGIFKKDESHADQGTVEGVKFLNVESCFRSENQQSLGWSFRDMHADVIDFEPDVILFDIIRGGNIAADNVQANLGRVTVFRVQDYSPNTCRLTCYNFRFDGSYAPKSSITLFEFDGPVPPKGDVSWMHWAVRLTGHVPYYKGLSKYDPANLIEINDSAAARGIPRGDLLFDITGPPMTQFESAGGPWMRPK